MVYRLLDKVIAAELVAATVRSKVVPYVEKHNLNLDHVLLNYTKVMREIFFGISVFEFPPSLPLW